MDGVKKGDGGKWEVRRERKEVGVTEWDTVGKGVRIGGSGC